MTPSLYEAAFQHAPLGILVRDRTGRVVDVNPQFCKLLGYSREQILEMSFVDFPPPEDAQRSWESYQDLVKGLTTTARFERRYIHSNGSVIWARVSISAVRGSGGEFLYGLSMVEDVTYEQQSKNIQRSMQLLYEGGVLGFMEGVVNGPVLKCNSQMSNILGVRSFAPDISWQKLVIAQDDWVWRRKTAELLLKRFVKPFEVTLKTTQGEVPVLFGAVLTGDSTYQAFALDLRSAREAQDLRDRYQTLEWFTRAASHDLQEPLRKIRAFGEILQDKHNMTLDTESQQYLGYMVNGAKRLSGLLDDLLQYSRTGGPAALKWHPVSALVQEALENLQVDKASITVECLPEVLVDHTQFVLVLQNILSNALKYRRGEQAVIRIVAVPNGLEIRDQGIGFEAKDKSRIFEPFCRLAGKHFQGTGLGLAISQRIVASHGGQITAESIKGEGSTFRITLPQANVRDLPQVAAA